MKAKKTVSEVLKIFLLISIGVAIGKELAFSRIDAAGLASLADVSGERKVIVYYMHTVPCWDCTFIKQVAEEVVHDDFATELEKGRIEYIALNYNAPENRALASQYRVGQNMVIVVRFEDGREVGYERLPQVMELVRQPDDLKEYLRAGIERALSGGRS